MNGRGARVCGPLLFFVEGMGKRAAMAKLRRGVEDAAPYVGDCPLVGGHANLRRGEGTPPYELWKRGM